jgi:diguanylate cyclase (GGDEF)-like protein
MLDLDHFKRFNDTHGHDAGDEILKYIGKLLQDTFRGSDISCRFGGEEFTVVLVNTDISDAEARLETFRETVKNGKIYFQDKLLPHITVSIGLAEAPRQGMTSTEIIHAADIALYSAKDAGRDVVKCSNVLAGETSHPLN